MTNNVDAPEFYGNDPESKPRSALVDAVLRVSRNLAGLDAEAICTAYPDARVTRSGAVVVVDTRPPLVDVRLVGEDVVVCGYWDEDVFEHVSSIEPGKLERLKELLA